MAGAILLLPNTPSWLGHGKLYFCFHTTLHGVACDSVFLGEYFPAFRKNLLPPSSGSAVKGEFIEVLI